MNLRWAHVHIGDSLGQGAVVRLRGTVSVIDGARVEGATKGGRERTVSIDAGTAAVLIQHRNREDAEQAWPGSPGSAGTACSAASSANRCSRTPPPR